jgi:ATP-dependent Zn protease
MQIDAVAKSRDGKFGIVSNDEREQTLNQLLTVCLFLESIIHF